MIESISKKVSPKEEQEIIDRLTNFGWQLQSSQEINTTDSHLEQRWGELYNVTTSENYVKLVFTRDTTMQNYQKIKELETSYNSIVDSEPEPPDFEFDFKTMLVGLALFIIPGVLCIAGYISSKKAWKKEWDAWYDKMHSYGKHIMEEASALLV